MMKHMRPSVQSSQPLKPSLPSLPKIQQLQICKPLCRFSRRELAICIGFSCPLLQFPHPFHLSKALAAEEDLLEKPNQEEPNPNTTTTTTATTITDHDNDASDVKETPKKIAFLDISIDGQQVGRIKMELNESEAPSGTSRFLNLVTGRAGSSYRRKEFVKIMPNYIQHGGVRSFGVDAELAKNGGNNLGGILDELVSELDRSKEKVPGTKNIAGSVGLVVRDPAKPPPKLKLVARRGKLEIDEEQVGSDPNGTEFVISTRDCPELDASTLVIGRIVEGMDVVEKIGKVKTVQENSGSPYFRVAKLIGDKRAIVAERGFNRPYSKIIVTNCGLLD